MLDKILLNNYSTSLVTHLIQFFLWHFFYRFRKFGATRTNKPFGNITVNVAVTNS